MRTLALALLLGACTPNELTVTPQRIAWEEIDFQQARPDGGYLPQEISVRNDGSRALDVEIVGFDEEHLLLGALLASEEFGSVQTLHDSMPKSWQRTIKHELTELGEQDLLCLTQAR